MMITFLYLIVPMLLLVTVSCEFRLQLFLSFFAFFFFFFLFSATLFPGFLPLPWTLYHICRARDAEKDVSLVALLQKIYPANCVCACVHSRVCQIPMCHPWPSISSAPGRHYVKQAPCQA